MPWPQRRNAGALHRCGPPGRPDNLASSAAPDPDERTPRELRRSFVPPPSALAFRSSKSRAVVNASSRTCLSVPVTWRRSWRGHRGPQGTPDGIAGLIAGLTAGSIALAVTSCGHTATRSRPTSKSQFGGQSRLSRSAFGVQPSDRGSSRAVPPLNKLGHCLIAPGKGHDGEPRVQHAAWHRAQPSGLHAPTLAAS